MSNQIILEIPLALTIGVSAEERAQLQTIEITLTLGLKNFKAGSTDDLRDALDYAEVRQLIKKQPGLYDCHLIEKLAEMTAKTVQTNFSDKLNYVIVRVHKYQERASVEISRKWS